MYTVVQSLSIRSSLMYRRWKAVRSPSAIARNVAASSSLPQRAADSATMQAVRYADAVATTPGSALAVQGLSGGASGSSQSPNWKLSVPYSVFGEQRAHAFRVRDHRRQGLPERGKIAVCAPHRPRNPHDGVAPYRHGLRGGEGQLHVLEDVGHDQGDASVVVRLLGSDIPEPVLQEPADIEERRPRSVRRRRCLLSIPVVLHAGDSRSAHRGSSRACSTRRSRAVG